MLGVTQLCGFGAGGGAEIVVTDNGDVLFPGPAATTHGYGSQSSTGPATVLVVSWSHVTNVALSRVPWDGVDGTILAQLVRNADEFLGVAIVTWATARSGTLSLTFGSIVNDSAVTILSLSNARTPLVAVDTDGANNASGTTIALSALASPGRGGVRIWGLANETDTTSGSFDRGVEASDIDAGGYRHLVGYEIGDTAATITATSANDGKTFVGASIR